jgi:hypothetical protein
LANENLALNKGPKNFELYIPYSEVPGIDQAENLKLQLIVVEVDPGGDMKVLGKTDTVSYQVTRSSKETAPTLISFPTVEKS